MSGLHSHQGHSLRLLGSYEQDEVRVNVDIYTLVRELCDKVDRGKLRDSRDLTKKIKNLSHHKMILGRRREK